MNLANFSGRVLLEGLLLEGLLLERGSVNWLRRADMLEVCYSSYRK